MPVLSLSIENFRASILLAKLIDGFSPILPAGYCLLPTLIKPLKKVPVVKTTEFENILEKLFKISPFTTLFSTMMSSTDPSIIVRFSSLNKIS